MPNASRFVNKLPKNCWLVAKLDTRSRFYVFLCLQWAEGVPWEGEAGAVSEGRTDESRRRRRHSGHWKGDESQGKYEDGEADADDDDDDDGDADADDDDGQDNEEDTEREINLKKTI